jgi:hypothetical protein
MVTNLSAESLEGFIFALSIKKRHLDVENAQH